MALAAGCLILLPTASWQLVWDRSRILEGQWWRVITGQLVHFSPSHLLWNLAVLLPAGIWSERLEPVRARLLYLVGSLVIGFALLAFEPHLLRYGGLSGLAAAMLAFLALAQLRTETADRWFWRLVLALLALKIVAEVILASPLLAHIPDPAVRSVPLAHLGGIVAALFTLHARPRRFRGA